MKRIVGIGIGIVYLGISALTLRTAAVGWQAGHSDLGFWWSVIAALLAIAGLGAVIGTWIHTRPGSA